jgi:antitoxin (DNA-binding transcriptional repressor) of toxin-antitoxin stability system
MDEVTVRDLRNRGGNVLDRVARGETLTVTRDGRPVAELRRNPPASSALSSRLSAVSTHYHRFGIVLAFRADAV